MLHIRLDIIHLFTDCVWNSVCVWGKPLGNSSCLGLNKRAILLTTSELVFYYTEVFTLNNCFIITFDDVVELFSITDTLITQNKPSTNQITVNKNLRQRAREIIRTG